MSHQRTVKNTIISRNDTISTEECSLILLQPTERKLFFFLWNLVRGFFGRPLNWSEDAADLFGCNARKHIVHDVKKKKREEKKNAVLRFYIREPWSWKSWKMKEKETLGRVDGALETDSVCCGWMMATMWMATRWAQMTPAMLSMAGTGIETNIV